MPDPKSESLTTTSVTDKLRQWGTTHAAARAAERAAAQHVGPAAHPHEQDARRLRAHADRLHGEIYRELGRPGL